MPKFVFYQNPKWIYIDWLSDGNLRNVKNEQLNEFLSDYGDLISPVELEKNEFGMYTGRRKARLDLNKDKNLERVKWLDFDIEMDGKMQKFKGKVKFFYNGQPIFCKKCSKEHTQKCPQQIKEEELFKEYELSRKEKIASLFVTDSNCSLLNEKSVFADTNVASGAKIGHCANVLENSDLESYKNIIISAGINNIDLNAQTNIDKWETQVKSEMEKVEKIALKCAEKGMNIRVVPVSDFPITKSTGKAKQMQSKINQMFDKMEKDICQKFNGALRVVKIPIKSEEESFRDNKHFTELQTAIMLETIDSSLPEDNKVINRTRPKGVLLTTSEKYRGVYATYRYGCGRCTKIGHNEKSCNLNLESNKIKRNERLSSGDNEDSKKIKLNGLQDVQAS